MANRMKVEEKNERILRNLLKLPENRRCINCNSFVPQYACINFSTFVCTTCSGIHREFTHRVKSVSMAKFTPPEISALQGGGNANAREIYLKEWDSQCNSLPDVSNIERLRDFIKHVYVDRRYTGEKNLEKPLREKMGETEEFNGNKRIDTQQVGSRNPSYDQDNWKNIDQKSSPSHAEVVNDWRREDRFGNRRRSEDRSSDGSSKLEVRSPDSLRDSDMSTPPIVRPVRDILGDSVSPLRIIEPPKVTTGRSADGWAHTKRTASSGSLASSDTNPSDIKVEASFIDFNSVPDPPTISQAQQAAVGASSVKFTASSGNDWANFDSAQEVTKHAQPLSSVESVLSELDPQQHFVFPGSVSKPISQLVTPVIGGSSLDSRSGGRKALPEDLFAMNYSYTPSPVPGWYSGTPRVAAVPMQYNTPMAMPNIYPVSRSINPFDAGNEQSPAQAPTFPSVSSLQAALPRTTTPAGLLRTSSLETPQFHPSPMLTQAPAAYGSAFPPRSFVGQGIPRSMPPRPQGQSESAFGSLNPNPHPHSASSNFTGGNPFG